MGLCLLTAYTACTDKTSYPINAIKNIFIGNVVTGHTGDVHLCPNLSFNVPFEQQNVEKNVGFQ